MHQEQPLSFAEAVNRAEFWLPLAATISSL